MAMIRVLTVAAVAALLALAGCTSVHTTSPRSAFAHFQTFSFVENQDADDNGGAAGPAIREAVASDLHGKGYQYVDHNPDFLVAYHTRLRETTQVVQSVRYGWTNAWPGPGLSQVQAYPYVTGTIILDFIDPHSGQIFWRGSATRGVNNPDDPNLDQVQAAVGKVIKRYPAATAAAAGATRM
jgi:hypothetical protein